MIDPISDMLTRIRNAGRALLPAVEIPHSKIKESIAHILKREGYLAEVAVEQKVALPFKTIILKLKYNGRKPLIEGIRRISSPGLRSYAGAKKIPRVRANLGVSILSTSQGIMTGAQARKKNIGGEILCFIW